MAAGKKIALVTCSTRGRRLNPFITSYVQQVVAPLWPSITIETLDLASPRLPLFDEPTTPAQHPHDDPTPHYAREHTRAWSAAVRQYDGFIFVTPQYNWSVPASLKNALDYLFHEWKGKPAGIVSYGSRGGGKSASHLRDILHGLRMKPAPSAPGLTTTLDMVGLCEELGSVRQEDKVRWKEAGVEEQLASMMEEMRLELSAA
ncbi:NADPH-dependent FMN reductase [Hirsutella rhossiliensis]|uniref:NADPH-dependent FMN reductase domain-containing protein n=1 Tax=Hirsutella rhossiliensis TaxID=111463 RepID=A0A9P8MZA6_9HYPO|nr:NADPH-dependent FMN reductase domain-containing protein [Hirsutella rhossiliensis]KAH0963742.1 NADPH-dependent FMN reductase domain-containing protein [Hirsutella rhossiliensis]